MGLTLASLSDAIRREQDWLAQTLSEGTWLDDVCLITAVTLAAASVLSLLVLLADVV
jgi:hypothetical protein